MGVALKIRLDQRSGCASAENNETSHCATDNKSAFRLLIPFFTPSLMFSLFIFYFFTLLFPFVGAHVAAWHKGQSCLRARTCSNFLRVAFVGMYCLNGTTPGVDDANSNTIANPLFNVLGRLF